MCFVYLVVSFCCFVISLGGCLFLASSMVGTSHCLQIWSKNSVGRLVFSLVFMDCRELMKLVEKL
jgi:hypothetical protein